LGCFVGCFLFPGELRWGCSCLLWPACSATGLILAGHRGVSPRGGPTTLLVSFRVNVPSQLMRRPLFSTFRYTRGPRGALPALGISSLRPDRLRPAGACVRAIWSARTSPRSACCWPEGCFRTPPAFLRPAARHTNGLCPFPTAARSLSASDTHRDLTHERRLPRPLSEDPCERAESWWQGGPAAARVEQNQYQETAAERSTGLLGSLWKDLSESRQRGGRGYKGRCGAASLCRVCFSRPGGRVVSIPGFWIPG